MQLIYDAVRIKHRIAYEQDCIDELRDIARTELGVDPKDFNALVQHYLKEATC
jgi:hypothetical protein